MRGSLCRKIRISAAFLTWNQATNFASRRFRRRYHRLSKQDRQLFRRTVASYANSRKALSGSDAGVRLLTSLLPLR